MNTAVKKVILLLLLIIVTCTFPSIRPCSWRYAQPSSATRDPTVDGSGLPGVVRASRQHSQFFRQEYVADVDGFFFLLQDPLGVTCCTFANALLHLVLSSLLCEFTAPLEFSKRHFTEVRYLFSVTLNTSFVQLRGCISLSDHPRAISGLGISCALSLTAPHLNSALHPASHVSRPLLSYWACISALRIIML